MLLTLCIHSAALPLCAALSTYLRYASLAVLTVPCIYALFVSLSLLPQLICNRHSYKLLLLSFKP